MTSIPVSFIRESLLHPSPQIVHIAIHVVLQISDQWFIYRYIMIHFIHDFLTVINCLVDNVKLITD